MGRPANQTFAGLCEAIANHNSEQDADIYAYWKAEDRLLAIGMKGLAMARALVPSSYECDCGHQIHFSENTVRGMEAESKGKRKPERIVDSEDNQHMVEFASGRAVAVICPKSGRCEITGWA